MMQADGAGTDAEIWDAVIVGGGPAGALAGIALARLGRRALVIEKTSEPRFHVGESLLPDTFNLLCEFGLEPAIRALPHVPKLGADFCMAYGGRMLEIDFKDGYCEGFETFSIERSLFDFMLLGEAEKAGAHVLRDTTIKQIVSLKDGDVRVLTDKGIEIRGRYLLDASGQSTLVAKHFGTRQAVEDSKLQKIAYANQFEHVERSRGREGCPLIVMMEEGWYWLIPLTETRTSVGMVLDADVARKIGREQNIAPNEMLRWGIARCPFLRDRMKNATGSETNIVAANFSYYCRPYSGAGYFLIGDAATFMDPIFSTGILIAARGALACAEYIDKILDGNMNPARARANYNRLIENSTSVLYRLVRQYYDHSFRELFLMGKGPLGVHRAIIGLLSGNVFPKVPFKIRWRMKVFEFLIRRNRRKQLVPRRRRFSILHAKPGEWGRNPVAAQHV